MTQIESLITKARRYCIENHLYWTEEYEKKRSGNDFPYTYTENDYNLFPRYHVLDAILQGVQLIINKKFNSLEECKLELKRIGKESHTINTIKSNNELHLLAKLSKFFSRSGKNNKTEENAINDERNKFIEFIDSQDLKSIIDVEPLPYKRKLEENESDTVRKELLKNWNFDGGYWEPLDNKSPKPILFLMKDNFKTDDKNEIESLLKNHIKKDRVFMITEERVDYEIELNLLDFDLYESIICDDTFEWVIYGSHESTISFGGSFIIERLNTLFKNRKDKLNKWEQNW